MVIGPVLMVLSRCLTMDEAYEDIDWKSVFLAAVIGASTSFLTPVGHKANVLVFGPGGCRFFDYTRTGALLTVALLVVSMIFIPLFWRLFP